MWTLLPALLCLPQVLPSKEPVFSSVPTAVKTTEHVTVLLPCDVDNLGDRVVKWWKGELLVADSSKMVESPANIRLYQNNSLEVSDVSSSDSGDYRCQVNRPHPWSPISQLHSILVLYPPALKTVPESGLVEVELHKEITIGCNPSGVPKPSLRWTFKGKEIQQLSMRNTLRFTATERSMEGEYICIANNGVGDEATASITLKLIYAPEVEIKRHWVHTAPGLRTEISCNLQANPPAKVEWLRNNKQIISGNRIVLLNLGEKQMLIIRNTRISDFGFYTCRASNSLGTSQSIAQISGIANIAVFKKGFKNLSDNNYTLVWEVESYSPIIQHKLLFRKYAMHSRAHNWTKLIVPADAYSPGPFHTQVYTLTGLTKATIYETAVSTRNKFGWSQLSKMLKFATAGIEIPENELVISTELPFITQEIITEEHLSESSIQQQLNGLSTSSRILNLENLLLIFICVLLSNKNGHSFYLYL